MIPRIEDKEFPGYFRISSFPNYVINETGSVINKLTGQQLSGSRNEAGYVHYRLTVGGKTLTIGRHRLMGITFKHPGIPVAGLVVNHRNGIKGDDWIDNLEWTTQKRNIEHAGEIGISSKCVPIEVRCVDTGNVTGYPSFIEYARESGLSKDAIAWRLSIGPKRVFPERKQYRKKHGGEDWCIPEDVERELLITPQTQPMLLKHLPSGTEKLFHQSAMLAKYLGLAPSTITGLLKRADQPILPGLYLLKRYSDPTPWRDVPDPYLDLELNTDTRVVHVFNPETGEERIFESCKECSVVMGVKTTTLNERLKKRSDKPSPDGFVYRYYSELHSPVNP